MSSSSSLWNQLAPEFMLMRSSFSLFCSYACFTQTHTIGYSISGVMIISNTDRGVGRIHSKCCNSIRELQNFIISAYTTDKVSKYRCIHHNLKFFNVKYLHLTTPLYMLVSIFVKYFKTLKLNEKMSISSHLWKAAK